MNSNGTDFINLVSCVSCRALIDVHGYADIWPIINPTIKIEPTRIKVAGDGHRLLRNLPSGIADFVILTLPKIVLADWAALPISAGQNSRIRMKKRLSR
jgi:hypothetical protein